MQILKFKKKISVKKVFQDARSLTQMKYSARDQTLKLVCLQLLQSEDVSLFEKCVSLSEECVHVFKEMSLYPDPKNKINYVRSNF